MQYTLFIVEHGIFLFYTKFCIEPIAGSNDRIHSHPTVHDFSSLFICCGTVLSSVGDEAQIVDGHLTARAFLRLLQLQQSRAGAEDDQGL